MCNVPFSNPFWAKTPAWPAFQNNDSWCALCQLPLLLFWKCKSNSFQNLFWYCLLSVESDTVSTESNLCSQCPSAWLLRGWGLSIRGSGFLRCSGGSFISILYLGLLSRMSLEQGALKLRSLETSGPMQAFFSQMKRRNPGLLTDGRTLSSVPGKAAKLLQQDVTSSLWCLSLHFSMWDSDFYLTGLFWKLNQTH